MRVGRGMWWAAWNGSRMGGTRSCHEGLAHVEHEQGGGHQWSREVAAKTGGKEGVVAQKRRRAVGVLRRGTHGAVCARMSARRVVCACTSHIYINPHPAILDSWGHPQYILRYK